MLAIVNIKPILKFANRTHLIKNEFSFKLHYIPLPFRNFASDWLPRHRPHNPKHDRMLVRRCARLLLANGSGGVIQKQSGGSRFSFPSNLSLFYCNPNIGHTCLKMGIKCIIFISFYII